MSELNNIVIADMLAGVQFERDKNYEAYEQAKRGKRPRLRRGHCS